MAEDDTISAMWCSLVPTIQYQYGGAQPNMEMTEAEADNYNDAESEAETSVDVEALSNYIEARVLHLPPQHILPNTNYWNHWDHMPQSYPITEHIDHYVQDQDAAPINYILKEQEITQAYSKAGEFSSDVKIAQVNDIKPIRRVSELRRKEYSHSHVPNIMSIGPYHYSFYPDLLPGPNQDKSKINDLDIEKQRLLQLYPAKKYKKAFRNTMLTTSDEDKCMKKIKEQEIKQYYPDILRFDYWEKMADDCDQNEYDRLLSRCLVIDACAILGFLHIVKVKEKNLKDWIDKYKKQEKENPNADDLDQETEGGGIDYATEQHIYSFERDILPGGSSDLLHEIILIENQIPYIVLEIVYNQINKSDDESSLKSQIINYLHKNMLSLYSKATPECPIITEESIQFEYILDYCHIYFKPTLDKYNKPTQLGTSWKPTKSKSTISNRWRRATDLYEAGITFKRFECHCRSLLDVNFEDGVLEIPTLTIDLQTRTLFSNIIAFEQKLDNPNTSNNYFTAYVKLMADLVTTVDDIKLLAKKRIIEHHFRTDEDLLQLFEDLVKGVRFRVDQDNYLTQMFATLELHYESRPKKWMADLKRKHCNTPWMIIGSVFGIIISTFTIVQTVYAIKGN